MHPDFIGIGAQKAGTTWLDRNLRIHPEIWMPSLKEVHYFNRTPNRRRKQLEFRWNAQKKHFRWKDLLWDARFFLGPGGLLPPVSYRGYKSLFKPGKGQIAGEITPDYALLEENVVSRIHEHMPGTKILFMMRNPIERAWSQTTMYFGQEQKKPVNTVDEALLRKYFKRGGVRRRTNYVRALMTWEQFYPEDRIFAGFLEDIHFHPGRLLEEVYRFLGVDPSFSSRIMNRKVHSRSTGKMPTKLATDLAGLYYNQIQRLEKRFGGYASFWLYCADRLIEDPPEEDVIPYPLWESFLWEDWMKEAGTPASPEPPEARFQSGSLASVAAAGRNGHEG